MREINYDTYELFLKFAIPYFFSYQMQLKSVHSIFAARDYFSIPGLLNYSTSSINNS